MQIKTLKVGQIVEGTIVTVEENTIYLDVQSFTEGKIHLDNYAKPAPDSFIGLVEKGQKIKAKVMKMTDEPSQILLSRLPLLAKENFSKLEELVKTKEVVKAKVRQITEKGLVLFYLENEIFLPYSLLDFELVKSKNSLKNKTLEIQIIEAVEDGRRRRIRASRKEIFEAERQRAYEERQQLRKDELDTINTGDILTGTVDKLEPHAATIRFNHVVGLLRISQVSHHRIEKIEDVLSVGEDVSVKVIKKEGNRLDLSIKALLKTPYELFYETHKIGQTVTGKVFQKLPFGIIVELERDVRGLLHKNEYSWNPNDNFDSYVKIGDDITLSIIQLDLKKERISLSKRALEDNPWKNVKVKQGDIVNAKISEVSKDGIKVLVDGVLGDIAVNELSDEKIGRPEEYFAVDDSVNAIVIEINKEQWILKLSIRRLLEKTLRESYEQYLEDDDKNNSQTIGDLIDGEE